MLTAESDFSLEPISAYDLSATDLRKEAEEIAAEVERFAFQHDKQAHAFRLTSPDTAEVGSVLYCNGRAGVAWGADAQWTDADSAEDAVRRFLTGEMVN